MDYGPTHRPSGEPQRRRVEGFARLRHVCAALLGCVVLAVPFAGCGKEVSSDSRAAICRYFLAVYERVAKDLYTTNQTHERVLGLDTLPPPVSAASRLVTDFVSSL